jgi:hypothetical protein
MQVLSKPVNSKQMYFEVIINCVMMRIKYETIRSLHEMAQKLSAEFAIETSQC